MNPAAIESHLRHVLVDWSVIIAMAWLFGRLGRKLKQPLAVGEILAGILLGPSALGVVWPEVGEYLFRQETQQSLQLLGKLGLIFLLFQVGMEFDYGHLRTRSRTVVAVSAMGIAAPFLCGLAVGPWLHRHFAAELPALGFQLFLCIALSISALPIMGRILLEMRLERTPIGAMGISSAAIDDVIGWILLAVASAVVSSGFDGRALALQVGGILLFLGLLRWIIGPLLRRWWRASYARHHGLTASFMTLLLITLFGCSLITNALGIFAIFGAFLLGVALHQEVELVRAWRQRFADFVLVALVPIFFTNTGLNTNIGSLGTALAWTGAGVVLLAAVAGKLGGCFLGARLTGLDSRSAGCVAALMNTRALMALVAINIGRDLGLLNQTLFTMLVLMALITTAMTGPLLRWWLPRELRAQVP
ncbi:MAG: cation:proton antiporter [Limisphaerales bacterium]